MDKTNMDKPLVIIRCITYNHEPYIRQCLDGFVMQQTTFPFYAVVHDDASTDGTADIVREYAEKYPDIIHPIFETENQYSKHDGSFRRITFEACKDAKYVAMCEGDDYWTDPLKLQKQVDFLEEHEEFVLAFHDAKIIDEKGNLIAESKIKLYYTEKMYRDWSEFDLMCANTPPTPTVMYRRNCLDNVLSEMQNSKKIINGDTLIASIMGKYGKGKFQEDISNSVCRVHVGGVWQLKPELYKRINSYKTFTFLQHVHKGNKNVKKYMFNMRFFLINRIIQINIKEGNKKEFIHYYFIYLGMLIKMFNLKTMYVKNKDVAHWIKMKVLESRKC